MVGELICWLAKLQGLWT